MFKVPPAAADQTDRRRPGPRLRVLVALLVGTSLLAGCRSSSDARHPTGQSGNPTGQAGQQVPAAEVTVTPADGTSKVALGKPVEVTISQGTISSVEVTTTAGKVL